MKKTMNVDFNWDEAFAKLFIKCLSEYKSGNKKYDTYYDDRESEFLQSIGYRKIELFDFVEDFAVVGEPSITTATMIAAVRRDYLNFIQKGTLSQKIIANEDLPSKDEKAEGIVWLPRIIAKGNAKLRGELDNDTMYCCGGDRKFLKKYDIHPADFLRLCWSAGEDESKVHAFVKSRAEALGNLD